MLGEYGNTAIETWRFSSGSGWIGVDRSTPAIAHRFCWPVSCWQTLMYGPLGSDGLATRMLTTA